MQYNSSAYHLFSENNVYIEQIIDNSKKTISEAQKKFIRAFYWHVSMLNISEKEIQQFSFFADQAFSFIQNLKNDEEKINIYSPDFLEKNHKFSVIEVLSSDLPFLVDSVVAALEKIKIKTFRVIYPVIHVSRDEKGDLVDILDKESEEAKCEVIIHFHVQHIEDDAFIKKIKDHILNIIAHVKLAVVDWKDMLSGIYYLTDLFQEKALVNADFEERKEFLSSLGSKYFVFLGAVQYKFEKDKFEKNKILGILKKDKHLFNIIEETIFAKEQLKDKQHYINIGKLNQASIIHRDVNLDYVCIKTFDENHKLISADVFVGLFTSILYFQSATLIPLIRHKVISILEKAEFSSSSHGGKELVSIIESLPRDELFQIQIDELYRIVMEVYALMHFPDLRLFMRKNEGGKFVTFLVFIPHDRINSETENKIQNIMVKEYGNIITSNFVHINDSQMCYYHIILDLKDNINSNFIDCAQIEKKINGETFLWREDLKDMLVDKYGIGAGYNYYSKYEDAFPESYKERYRPNEEVIKDIVNLEKIAIDKKVIFSLNKICPDNLCSIVLKIYHNSEIPLSSIIPMIHNIGFEAQAEHIFEIELENDSSLWIHNFYLTTKECNLDDLSLAQQNIEETLTAIWNNKAISDEYNKLILSTNLVYREVSLLRAVGKYLYQIKFGYSKEYIGYVLTRNPKISKAIIEAFKYKFNPEIDVKIRHDKYIFYKGLIIQNLIGVSDPLEDKVIRKIVEIIEAMVRTNYYVKDNLGDYKSYISFKIQSKEISNLPKPVPFMEVFVYSSLFEAIHLRSDKVSRGGIRWSDRSEDFRTEVLGLVKAQIPKNTIIVPSGSKGGFVINNSVNMTRDEFYQTGVECYKNFLRGILDITDNIVNSKIVTPENIICYDEKDPYLVVAADKGTASFSDIANSISAEYNFWLGDAFASGGSMGYDHKKMAITAKGGWVSVMRHFMEMNFDITKKDFTVVGIGDMAGDVFGNGMLLSKHIRLIAAFNHMHIFVDPNPDSEISFKERKRLFTLKTSTWLDYNPKILSKGGKIFDRKAKSLELTKEIKETFKIDQDVISPDEFITIILKAEVDLLWNGGIGTYVKSSLEDNFEIGDKANDNLRINGQDLRCKVVGEGGNLGFSQGGRVEYAMSGGRINTDAIDNSAGVDCSDHEVNIKIVFEKMMKSGQMTIVARNKILEEMTDEVADLVLTDNKLQTLALSISEHQGYSQLSSLKRFIDLLEREGRIDRKLLGLPSKEDFVQLFVAKQGLTRPELASLLPQSKLSIFDNLINTKLPDDEFFNDSLQAYFPKIMQNEFANEIKNHPLKREIIATMITNCLVNRIGIDFTHLTSEDYGYSIVDIAKAYIITRESFELEDLWNEVDNLSGKIASNIQLDLCIEIKKFVMRSSLWLVRKSPTKLNIVKNIANYKDGVFNLSKIIVTHLTGIAKEQYDINYIKFIESSVPKEIAKKVSCLRSLSSGFNILNIIDKVELPLEEVTKLYFDISDFFNFDWLRACSDKLTIDFDWQRLSVRSFKDELYDTHREIVLYVINFCQDGGNLDGWYQAEEKNISRYSKYILDIQKYEHIEYAMLDLALKNLKLMR